MHRTKGRQHLETILAECALIRGVGCVEHRIVHEFNWFIHTIIFGKDEEKAGLKPYLDKVDFDDKGLKATKAAEKNILGWGKAFRRYYADKEKEFDAAFRDELATLKGSQD
jgi:hypothetical protein